MDDNKKKIISQRIDRVVEALSKNRIGAFRVDTKEDAVKLVGSLLDEGDTVACGGSVTLVESGVLALLKSGHYRFIDRFDGKMSKEEAERLTHGCDAFFMSSNAITENGELYNVDGNSNRVSSLVYGPKKVIVVAGYNKIVPDLPAAITRVKEVAAPANGVRLGTDTPCAKTGKCCACDGRMTSGCKSPDRMCVNYVVTGYQRSERITVVIVGEELGY
jgi:hypothetical protein